MTSLVLYLWYEYYEESCFELTCLLSTTEVSATPLVKLDVIITIVLIIGSNVHFWRIIILAYYHKWFGF